MQVRSPPENGGPVEEARAEGIVGISFAHERLTTGGPSLLVWVAMIRSKARFGACACTLFVSLSSAACMAPVGSELSVPPDAAQTCAEHCGSIGMRLSAVAIMANNVGCVCQGGKGAAATGEGTADQSATAAAGMATILMQQAAEENARHQQAVQQRMFTTK
jgi:hypothetical protein